MRFSAFCISAAAFSIVVSSSGPAFAAAPNKITKPTRSAAKPAATKTKQPPSFEEVMKFVDKLFPPQPAPDPARLALAQTSVRAIWPDGQYGKMLTGLMGGIYERVMNLKESDLAAMGKPTKATSGTTNPDASLHDQLAADDPYFDQRVAAIRAALNEEVGKVSAVVDPRMRDGLARAMARRFDARQLTDINAFFATPSGQALASQYMQLWLDPDTIRSVFGSLPDMMKLMPDMMTKVKAASDKFPKPPKKDKPADKH